MAHGNCKSTGQDLKQRAQALLDLSSSAVEADSGEAMQTIIRDLLADRSRLERQLDRQNVELSTANKKLDEVVDQVRRIKQTLHSRETKLNAIVDNAVDGIVTIDEGGMITTFNPAAERIFGYREEEMLGRNINLLVPPPDREHHEDYIKHYLETGESTIIGVGREVAGRHKDGSSVPLQLLVTEFRVGRARCFAATLRDLTEKRRSEQEKRARLDELSHVARLSLMGEMASGLAHELNQPLTAVASYLQACRRLIDTGNLDKLKTALINAERQALHAGKIIRRMRSFVSKRRTRMAPTDINALIKEAITLSEPNRRHNDVRLVLRLSESLPPVCADNVQIEQVLLNLIRNSIEAMAEIPAEEVRRLLIATGVSTDGEIQIKVTFQDTGPGVSGDQIACIFEPFHTTKPKGMGMGLSISRSIIQAHGGRLWVDRDAPGGATFHFTLPLADACDQCE
jgi:two-component system sensor kinase FixL